MGIETVIREQGDVIEGLWWESVQDWPATASQERGTVEQQLRERLVALCEVLERGPTGHISRALVDEEVSQSLAMGNRPPHVVWAYALIERCVYQAWWMARGDWPSEEEGRRLRGALQEVVAIAIEHICEEMVRDEDKSERRVLEALDSAAEASLDDSPAATTRACLAVVREAFGPRAAAALVLFDQPGDPVERVWEGPGAADADDDLARRVLRERELLISVEDSRFGEGGAGTGARVLLGRALPLAGGRQGALMIGLEDFPSSRRRRLLETIAERLAQALDRAQRHRAARAELLRMTEERNLREQFVDALAHDLRGPLTVARLSLETIRQKLEQPDLTHAARRAALSVDRADNMLRDLLDASRVRAGEPLPLALADCDLSSLLSEVVDEVSDIHGPRFVVRVEPGLAGVWCARELRRAVWNLLMNAVQHGAHDGPIVVAAARFRGGIRLVVENAGPPIAQDVLGRIFDPYRRLGGGGWGLGLTLVRACAEAHGGSVTVASAEGAPTYFTIVLPLDSRSYYQELMRRAAAGFGSSESRVQC